MELVSRGEGEYRFVRAEEGSQISMDCGRSKALRNETVATAMKEHRRRTIRLSEPSLVAGRSTSGAMQMARTQSTQNTAAATRMNFTMVA